MVVIVRYSEIGLKGQNRPFFEKKLVTNIKLSIKNNNQPHAEIKRKTGRILIYTSNPCKSLSKVFGIASFSESIELDYDIDSICKTALLLYKKGTFRITAHCLTNCGLSSQRINEIVGKYIVDQTKAKVSLKEPELNIGIEVIGNKAYLFTEKEKGPGGLPIGTQGLVAVLLENKKSIDAAIAMMKRGCKVVLIKSKDNIDIKALFDYDPKIRIENEIPDKAEAIVVSDTLKDSKERHFNKPVLKPLVGEWQK